MEFFSKFNLFFALLILVLSMLSCQYDSNNDRFDPVVAMEVPWEEYLDLKLTESGWRLSYGNERGNFCQLGDAEPFACDGGSCFITRDEAHRACVGCTSNNIRACTGSLGGVIFIILNQMAVDYPNVNIDYNLYDDNDNVINSIDGQIGSKMTEINSVNQQSSATRFAVRLSSN
jgi:hypothetical protein